MKKMTLVAALAACFAGAAGSPAVAEDTVRLYGIVDAGPGYSRIDYQGKTFSRWGLRSRDSRFGLMGTHDIGDGYSVGFQLENGFDVLTGESPTTRLFNRMAVLSLNHRRFGSLDMGRHYNMASRYMADYDPFENGYELAGSDSTMSSNKRMDNLVLYRTPQVGGWQAGVGYSFEVDQDRNDDENAQRIRNWEADTRPFKGPRPSFFSTADHTRLVTAGVRYARNAFSMAATYDIARRRHDESRQDRSRKIQVYFVGASYDFNPVTIYGSWSQTFGGWLAAKNMEHNPGEQSQQFTDVQFAQGFRADSAMVGLAINDGPSRYMASVQRAEPNNDRLTGGSTASNIYALGYRYLLSKRTQIQVHAAYAQNFAFIKGMKGVGTGVHMTHYF